MEAAARGNVKLVEQLLAFGALVFHPGLLSDPASNLVKHLPLSDDDGDDACCGGRGKLQQHQAATAAEVAAETAALDAQRVLLEEEAHDLEVLQQQMQGQASAVRKRLQRMLSDAADELEGDDVDSLQQELEDSTEKASLADQAMLDTLSDHAERLVEILSQLRRRCSLEGARRRV
jgi:hypothetical protein